MSDTCDIHEYQALHYIRISLWPKNGLKEYEIMKLADHVNFATTHKFFLTVWQRLERGKK